jgi:hypothetical protein
MQFDNHPVIIKCQMIIEDDYDQRLAEQVRKAEDCIGRLKNYIHTV